MMIPGKILHSIAWRLKRNNGYPLIFIIILLVGLSPDLLCQAAGNDHVKNSGPEVYFSLAYSGNNLWNPGAAAVAGISGASKRTVNRKGKLNEYLIYYTGKAGGYLDPASHLGFYNHYGWTIRKINIEHQWIHALHLQPAGFYRSFLGETYEVDGWNVMNRVFLPGRWYFAPSLGYQLGRTPVKSRKGSLFAGISCILLVPYNTYVMPLVNVELGWTFDGKQSNRENE